MSKSTVVEWLNENSFRAYPLISSSPRYFVKGIKKYDLFAAITDAQLLFSNLPEKVNLEKIVTNGTTATVYITGQPNFIINNYTTSRNVDQFIYVYNSNNSLIVLGSEFTKLLSNTTYKFTNCEFEACTLVEVSGIYSGVSSLTIQGDDTPITGETTFIEGYQLSLIPNGQTINLEVGRNEGIPLSCEITAGNVPSNCSNIITSLNGAMPNKTGTPIKLVAGSHINIFEDANNHRIYIGFDFDANDIPSQTQPLPTPIV